MLIDTGGIEMGGDDAFQGSIRAQAFEGAREADVIIFLVDGKAGINTDDEEVARILQKAGKPVFVAVNKMDNPARMDEVWEFYALGLGDPWPVSAQHGQRHGRLAGRGRERAAGGRSDPRGGGRGHQRGHHRPPERGEKLAHQQAHQQ